MATIDIENDEAFLEKSLAVTDSHGPKFIYKVCTHDDDNIICEYFMVKCSMDNVYEQEFIRELRDLIVVYALKREDYSDSISPFDVGAIWSKAKSKFVTADNTGEPGELILFALLESERKAPQILNKMSLKTSGSVHFHGLDGIHLGIKNNEIILYYGESKMKKSINTAIKDAIDALNNFHTTPKKEEFELDLISNHIDEKRFGERVTEIKEIINPYSEYKKEKLKKVYSVFIGFDWSSLKNINFRTIKKDIENILESCLNENKQKIHEKCKATIMKSKIDNSVEFFFLPFKDVQEIRNYFIKEVIS